VVLFVGVVLYEVLTGTRPFVGDNIPELLLSILEDSPRSIRAVRAEVPAAIETAALHCLEKESPTPATSSRAASLSDHRTIDWKATDRLEKVTTLSPRPKVARPDAIRLSSAREHSSHFL
jgi:serine/threonine protein kinase